MLILIVKIVGFFASKTVSSFFAKIIGKKSFPKHLVLNTHFKCFPESVDFNNFKLKRSHLYNHTLFEGFFFGYFNECSVLWSKIFYVKLMIFLCDFCMPVRYGVLQDEYLALQIWTNKRSIFSNFIKFRLVAFVVGNDQLLTSLYFDWCFGGHTWRGSKISVTMMINILLVCFETNLDPFNHLFDGNFGGDS